MSVSLLQCTCMSLSVNCSFRHVLETHTCIMSTAEATLSICIAFCSLGFIAMLIALTPLCNILQYLTAVQIEENMVLSYVCSKLIVYLLEPTQNIECR